MRLWVGFLAVSLNCAATFQAVAADPAAAVIEVGNRDLQQVIEAAPPHSVILCDPNRQLTLATPLSITKPLTLRGLCAKLPEKLGKTPLVIVKAKGVTLTEFNLTGNVDTVPQSERAPLIIIAAGRISPKYLRNVGQHCGNSVASGNT